ncbi:3-hydroxy-3-methylglutaryl-coenzyme A reductase [Arachis hypogaea]|nr:3-hydroxy-3-methylglutaryl-coenzyme A reductase [Arachis hypogaea]
MNFLETGHISLRRRKRYRFVTDLHFFSLIYLLGFFGIGLVQPIIAASSRPSSDDEAEEEEEEIIKDDARNPSPCPAGIIDCSAIAAISPAPPSLKPQLPLHVLPQIPPLFSDDEELVQ